MFGGEDAESGTDVRVTESFRALYAARLPDVSLGQSWEETRDRRKREQVARNRATKEKLELAIKVAQDEGDAEAVNLARQALAVQQLEEESLRARNARTRELAAARTQALFMAQQAAAFTPYVAPPGSLVEGTPPEPITAWQVNQVGRELIKSDPPASPEFEARLRAMNAARLRLQQLQASWSRDPEQAAIDAVRRELGVAMQIATDIGLIDQQQALLMMAAGGLNTEPMTSAEVRTLLFDLLAQATRSGALGLNRARTIARLIADAPKGANEGPGEVPIPDPAVPPDDDALRALALRTVPLDPSPLTPAGIEARGPELLLLARAVPDLLDRLESLERVVYDALLVNPCHAGHELHLETPFLCSEQVDDMGRALMAALNLDSRRLPRDVHRDADGNRESCCMRDGRIGTWLIYGQYINPDLRFGRREPEVRPARARPAILDDVAGALAEEGP